MPTTNRIHIVIGTPCYGGQIASSYFTSLLKFQAVCYQGGIQLTILMPSNDALITRARQNVVSYFLTDPTATHLLFIDADIGFEPEQVFRLLHFNQDVTAALYPLKRIDWDRVKKIAAGSATQLEAASLSYVCEWTKPNQIRGEFGRAQCVGNGFLLIRRSVLERMTEHYPELRYNHLRQPSDPFADSPYRYAFFNCLLDKETQSYLPEDYSFCRRWTDMGGEIWVDLKSRLDHTGPTVYHGDMLRRKDNAVPELTIKEEKHAK